MYYKAGHSEQLIKCVIDEEKTANSVEQIQFRIRYKLDKAGKTRPFKCLIDEKKTANSVEQI